MPKMQVDRFEEGFAVLVDEEENCFSVPRDLFGFPLHAGDILETEMRDGKPHSARFLSEETEAARADVRALMEKLKRK